MLKLSLLSENLYNCCEIDSFSINLCTQTETQLLKDFFPKCKSIIILAHHIKSSLEWAWFPFESERNNSTCPADLHLKSECEKIVYTLKEKGYNSSIVPYPGACGIRFKDLANKTGLGKLGDNFMFLHKDWGVWTHLRVIVTDTEITDNLPPCQNICINCGNCKSACQAKAIKDNTLLGIKCDEHQDMRNSKIEIQGTYIYKCEECARACPIGDMPERIAIFNKFN